MRENRTFGSEGGDGGSRFLPLSARFIGHNSVGEFATGVSPGSGDSVVRVA